MAEYIAQSEDLTAVADAIREKGSTTEQLSFPAGMVDAIGKIDTKLPEQEKTATPSTSQVVVVPDEGNVLSKVTVSAIQTESKIITPATSQQIITPTTGKFINQVTVNAMPSGALSTPTVSSNGLVTSKVGTSGYLASGTQSTMQLTTQSGKTVTPSTSTQTVVSSGRYTTGTVYVQGDSNLVASNIRDGYSIFGVLGTYVGSEPYSYERQTVTLSGTDTGRIYTDHTYPRGFIITMDGGFRSDTTWDDYTLMVMGLRDENFVAEMFTDYRRSSDAYVVNGSLYTDSSSIAGAYDITWRSNSIRVEMVNTSYPFEGDYAVVIFGDDWS